MKTNLICALLAFAPVSFALAQEPLRHLEGINGGTNELVNATAGALSATQEFEQQLDQIRAHRSPVRSEALLESLLQSDAPAEVKRPAWLELAMVAQQNRKLTRAQQLYSGYVRHFPKDPTIPEVLLRQGLLYREMGAPQMALSKLYAVMTVALHLKLDQMTYYRRIVLLAQTEIAETHYQEENFAEAAELLARLLKLDGKEINRPATHLKLMRCLARMNRQADLLTHAKDFLQLYPNDPGEAEVRFLQAATFNELGQTPAAFEQVLLLLAVRPAKASAENLDYWRQRAGNDVADRFYTKGDYASALELYRALAETNRSPVWQCPIFYQMGLVHERLGEIEHARALYERILQQKTVTKDDPDPSLKIVLDMAQWRHKTLAWFNPATQTAKALNPTPSRLP
jgi:tetratricopeptide (TPR) repeat protein